MRLSSRILLELVVLAALAAPVTARADMPSDDPICEPTEGCVVCELVQGDETDPAYQDCVEAAEADGLQKSCSEGATVSQEYWCPEGVDAHADADDGCSATGGPATQGAALLMTCAAALGLSLFRRRKVVAG
ncbi:MAG: hypothetical protein JNK04_18895 [Myxococcales bacterium]|nr:hypothetical protein [Myxococcales bacterium]